MVKHHKQRTKGNPNLVPEIVSRECEGADHVIKTPKFQRHFQEFRDTWINQSSPFARSV